MTLPQPSRSRVPLPAAARAPLVGPASIREPVPLGRALGRRARRGLLAALGALVASGAACADDPAPPLEVVVDAGPACERGTLDCECIGGSGCQDDLLCIAGRCLQTEGPRDMSPGMRPRPPPNNPNPPVTDAGDPSPDASSPPDPGLDAGTLDDGGTADAAGAD